ncbi:outer membrane beta-barrel protein [Nibribacter koreensis]|uniref:Outer membrane protein beta-barrel domain-containing protein n=1 Tax=Nibribacter koreensis TaxID=1084519 RepID=A0ABP8F576_9BACT
MKYVSLLASFLIISFLASAQEQDSANTGNYKFYVGVGLPNFQYQVSYDDSPKKTLFLSGEFLPIDIHFGYKISRRASVQLGLAYGRRTRESQTYGTPLNGNGQTVYHDYYERTRGFGIPVTGRFVFLNANRKMPIYVVAAVTPAFISSHFSETTTENNVTTTLYDEHNKGMDLFANAGFGLNYRVQRRLNGNVEFLLFKRNLTSQNFDLHGEQWLERLIGSLSLSFNYNFN